jgi:hypothetical protein
VFEELLLVAAVDVLIVLVCGSLLWFESMFELNVCISKLKVFLFVFRILKLYMIEMEN